MRKTFDDEFRRHSEPMGEELADAFEKYTQEMEKSSGDNPAYRHSHTIISIGIVISCMLYFTVYHNVRFLRHCV
jgi:hypothetical protein